MEPTEPPEFISDPYLRLEVLKLARGVPSADRGNAPTAEEMVAAAKVFEAFIWPTGGTGS